MIKVLLLAAAVIVVPQPLSASEAQSADQPVAFSHSQHAAVGTTCTFCHRYNPHTESLMVPSVQFCMVCHHQIGAGNPEVEKMRKFYDQRREIPWKKINGFSEWGNVYWKHRPHVEDAGIDCAFCHGNVADMGVPNPVVEFSMTWCMDCHRARRAEFEEPRLAAHCFTCHR